ncbi:DUF551 domain-containing protein [Enterobacter hormaechei]|nr:DUF551 domain-containing protein [Enterobacter hormaechei]
MSTISKERIANLLQFNSEGSDCQANAEQWEVHEMARIALASLEAEAVGKVILGEYDDCGCHPDARVACIAADGHADWENFKDGTRLFTATPASVVNAEPVSFDALRDAVAEVSGAPEMEWSDIYKGHQAVPFINFNSLARIVDKFRTAPPAPVSVPEPIKRNDTDGWWMYKGRRVGGGCAEWYNLALDDCRAAVLQGAEHVSNRDELPEGWVACSERMPDDEEDVLCFGQYGDNDIDEERYQFMGWLSSKGIKRVWRVSDGDSQNRRARVTHWMPLPAAPQREGENV